MCDSHAHHHEAAALASDEGRRTVVVGKGGVGKSTLTALLARVLARQGLPVIAVDGDEQRNLAATLGFDLSDAVAIVPLAEQADYIEEKTGARPGEGAGGMLRLNPDSSDAVERLGAIGPDGVRLLVMGSLKHAAGGCLCPENAMLAATVGGMRLHRGEVVLMDTHAGVEHFGRALARGFDQALVVIDPTFNAAQVGLDAARLAAELGIQSIHLAVNRVRHHDEFRRALETLQRLGGFGFSSTHELPFDELALAGEPSVEGLLAGSSLGDSALALATELVPQHALMEVA